MVTKTQNMGLIPDERNASGLWIKSKSYNHQQWHTISGRRWNAINARCNLLGAKQKLNPSYISCENRFLNFQKFVDWSREEVGYSNSDWHLDKDLIIKGNKFYSEDTCCYLPQAINCLLVKAERSRGKYPIGVSWHKRDKVFTAQCMWEGSKHLGYFPTALQAFMVYKSAKESHIKAVAEEWKHFISRKAYVSLVNYEVDIND